MKSRSGVLLQNVIDSGEFTADELARELATSFAEIDSYLRGDQVMPLSRQLALAALIIRKSPKLVRQGHALHAQASAAMSFQAQETSVHSEPPGRWNSTPRRPR
jgi:hypothetical protein